MNAITEEVYSVFEKHKNMVYDLEAGESEHEIQYELQSVFHEHGDGILDVLEQFVHGLIGEFYYPCCHVPIFCGFLSDDASLPKRVKMLQRLALNHANLTIKKESVNMLWNLGRTIELEEIFHKTDNNEIKRKIGGFFIVATLSKLVPAGQENVLLIGNLVYELLLDKYTENEIKKTETRRMEHLQNAEKKYGAEKMSELFNVFATHEFIPDYAAGKIMDLVVRSDNQKSNSRT